MSDKLYCPRCGKEFSGDTSYCRTCGLALDGVSEIVSGESATAPVMTTRPNFKLMRLGIVVFILGLVIGLLNGALRDFDLYPQAYGKLVFFAIIAIGMLLLGSGFLFTVKKYTKKKLSQPTPGTQRDVRFDTAQLAGQLNAAVVNDIEFPKNAREAEKMPIGSVTEPTTRNLDQ